MSISHKGISNHIYERKWEWTGKLRITYLASEKPYKGFDTLRNALDEILETKQKKD